MLNNKDKLYRKVTAIVVAVLMLACAILGICYSAGMFSGKTQTETGNSGALIAGTDKSNGISLTSTAVQVEGEEYQSTYTVTATIDNSNASDKSISWSIEWAAETEDTLSDYLTLSASETQSGESVTIYCYGAFNTQVVLTATANGDSTVTATATIDYVARLSGYDFGYYYTYSDKQPDQTVEVDSKLSLLTSNTITTWLSAGSEGIAGNISDLVSLNECYLSFSYSTTGSCQEYYTINSFTVSLTDDAKTAFAESFTENYFYSVPDFETFDLNSYVYKGDVIYSDDILSAILSADGTNGYSIDDDDFMSAIYEALIGLYEAGTAVFEIDLEITGNTSGLTYNFVSYAKLNPSAYYVAPEAVTLDETEIYM